MSAAKTSALDAAQYVSSAAHIDPSVPEPILPVPQAAAPILPAINADVKSPKNGYLINGAIIEVVQGNITDEATNAIVNPTDDKLGLTGSLSKAILDKGGTSIAAECKAIGTLNDVALTSAGSLKCRHIVHVLSPSNTAECKAECTPFSASALHKIRIDRNTADRRVARYSPRANGSLHYRRGGQ